MVRHRIQVVIDVRLNPVSRKKGFSKRSLTDALNAANIDYLHEPDLGNPRDNRTAFRSGYQFARQIYRDHLENGAAVVLAKVAARAHIDQVALLCFERAHDECHRSCITDLLKEENANFAVWKI